MKTKKLIRLPRVFRTKWLNALESGRYKQTKNDLCKEGKYCCLGVAGKVLRINDNELLHRSMPSDLENSQKYPKAFIISATQNSDFSNELANMNDEGSTFKQIAAYIRSNTRGI